MGLSWNGTDYDGRVTYSYGASADTYMQIGQAVFNNSLLQALILRLCIMIVILHHQDYIVL